MERAVILSGGTKVGVEHFPTELQTSSFIRRSRSQHSCGMPTLAEMEGQYIRHIVRSVDGNLMEASRVLGIARNTVKAKMRPHSES